MFPVNIAKFLRTPILKTFENGYFWKEHLAKISYSLELFPKDITKCKCNVNVNTIELLNISGF